MHFVIYEYYVNCGHTNEMKVWSSQLCLRFDQSQLSPKNVFGASTGFEPMASALVLQWSTNWAMKTHTLRAGQFVEFIVPVKGMKHMNIMWTADIQMKWRCLHSSVGGALQRYRRGHGFESRWSPENIFGLNCDCSNRKHNCDDHTFISFCSCLAFSQQNKTYNIVFRHFRGSQRHQSRFGAR